MDQSLISIFGDLSKIPLRIKRKQLKLLNQTKTLKYYEPINITCIGKGKYNGWMVDDNERFLLNNFIVVHNSRFQVGKDAASPRYIFTRLSDNTLHIFNKLDNPILNYLDDDGTKIEPSYFVPIIPMVLVNGCEGIGTGFSTYIPSYNPKDIIEILIKMLQDESYTPSNNELNPYFRGFCGEIKDLGDNKWASYGKYTKLDDYKIRITEIPIGTGVIPYKEFLESFINDSTRKKEKEKVKSKKFELRDVINRTKDEDDSIIIDIEFKNKDDLDKLIASDTLEKELKLVKTFSTNNMYLFNENCILTKYNSAIDILLEFFDIRLEYYVKRRKWMIEYIEEELRILKNKVRFIKEYIDNVIQINKKSKNEIVNILETNNYYKKEASYDYLLNMPIYTMSFERINELENNLKKKDEEYNFYKKNSPEQLWLIDIQNLQKII